MGVEFFLLVVIILIGVFAGVALYVGGGALWKGKTNPEGDTIEGSQEESAPARPKHVVTGRPANARIVPPIDEPGDLET